MKTEAEIRKHRDNMIADLRRESCYSRGASPPCTNCTSKAAAVCMLGWILDENGDYGRVVENLDAAAKRG